jgi:hypothetical protein
MCYELTGCDAKNPDDCSALCVKNPWSELPDWYKGMCPDASTPAICSKQAIKGKRCADRPELAGYRIDRMCTEVECAGECQAISIKYPWVVDEDPFICKADGSPALSCALMTNLVMGKPECENDDDCGSGKFCGMFLCKGVCSAMCMPLLTDYYFGFPPPQGGTGGGGPRDNCGGSKKKCAVSFPAGMSCPIGSVAMARDECGKCTSYCVDLVNKSLFKPGTTNTKKGGGSGKGKKSFTSTQTCATGTVTTCAVDPCSTATCSKVQKCVPE